MPLVRTSALCATALLFACSVGCESQTPPADAPKQYAQLVRVAAAQAEGRPDTSFFWLSNTSVTEARTLMLDLGIDYLRYDRSEGVLCKGFGPLGDTSLLRALVHFMPTQLEHSATLRASVSLTWRPRNGCAFGVIRRKSASCLRR